MNLKVVKIDNKLDMFQDDFEVTNNCIFYILRLDDKTIGRSKIYTSENVNNKFEIFILEDYRGNGYGRYFFEEMLKELKQIGYKEVNIQINRANVIAIKLIEDFDGVKVSQNKEITGFVLPIK